MASSPEFVNYICEQLEGLGAVRSRKMFGEYMVYLNDKPVIIVCDDRAMVKTLPCLEGLLQGRPAEPLTRGPRTTTCWTRTTGTPCGRRPGWRRRPPPCPRRKPPRKRRPPRRTAPPWDIAWPQQMKPALSDIGAWVKNPLFEALTGWMADTYGVEPSIEFSRCSMDRGWNVKYKKGAGPCAPCMSGRGGSPLW